MKVCEIKNGITTYQEVDYVDNFENSIEYKKLKIEELKKELAKYDYIGVKIAMGRATLEEYAEKIAYTETLREQIRQLENEVN